MSKYLFAIIMRTDLGMGKGKLCVQAGHASILAYAKAMDIPMNKEDSDGYNMTMRWLQEGQFKIVLKAPTQYSFSLNEFTKGTPESREAALLELAKRAREAGLPVVEVRDKGLTQVPSGSLTCIAIGPALSEEIRKVTGELKLL